MSDSAPSDADVTDVDREAFEFIRVDLAALETIGAKLAKALGKKKNSPDVVFLNAGVGGPIGSSGGEKYAKFAMDWGAAERRTTAHRNSFCGRLPSQPSETAHALLCVKLYACTL